MNVYVVCVQSAVECCMTQNVESVCTDIKKAHEHFRQLVNAALTDYKKPTVTDDWFDNNQEMQYDDDDYVVSYSPYSTFEIYENGYYTCNHTTVLIEEIELE